jgi:uncharacterized protein
MTTTDDGPAPLVAPEVLPLIEGVPRGPAPVIHPDSEPFWAGLAAGEFLVQRCSECGTRRFPIAPLCHVCLSFAYAWVRLEPHGTVHVAVVVARSTGAPQWRAAVPFTSGLVEMEHGLRLPGRILCSCAAPLRAGRAVTLCRIKTEGDGVVHAFWHDCPSTQPDLQRGDG